MSMETYLTELDINDKDYIYVVNLMNSKIGHNHGVTRFEVTKVWRVCNPDVSEKYNSLKTRISKESGGQSNETMLFHGTTKFNEIIRCGFDVACSKDTCMFGKGIYFAECSSKSNQYSGYRSQKNGRHILLCKVALGNVANETTARKGWTAPPSGSHSVMGVPRHGFLIHKEYVIYDGQQAVVDYLVQYNQI